MGHFLVHFLGYSLFIVAKDGAVIYGNYKKKI